MTAIAAHRFAPVLRAPSFLVLAPIATLPTLAVPALRLPPASLAQTTIYVNRETGDDCFNGLAPTPSLPTPLPPCPTPAPPGAPAGPLRTITAALTLINPLPGVYNYGPAYVIRIASRLDESIELPDGSFGTFAYGPGESFPLRIPPSTLLKADAANSEYQPSTGRLVPVTISGPPYAATGANTIEFVAGQNERYSSAGGLDGTEITPYGFRISGGARCLSLRADQAGVAQWPNFPFGSPAPSTATMSVRFDGIWSQGQSAYGLDAHIFNGAEGSFTVTNSKFTTGMDLPFGGGAALPQDPLFPHTGQALVHVVSVGTSTAASTLNPSFSNIVMAASPPATVPWGLLVEPSTNSVSTVVVTQLDLDGATNPASPYTDPEGILAGIEYASNTLNPTVGGQLAIPRFDLTASNVRNCAYFGAAVATGAGSINSYAVTRLEVSGNIFDQNGVTPPGSTALNSWGSTHRAFVGAGLHMVYKQANSWFFGTIASNVVTKNRTGIALVSGSANPLAGALPAFPPAGPPGSQGLVISGNNISEQALWPPGYPPEIPDFFGDGVGVVFAGDSAPNGNGPGTLDARFILERNRIFANARHGVLVGHTGGGMFSPVMRNNRIYENGNVAPDPLTGLLSSGGPPGDGVRIWYTGLGAPGAALAPTLLHETVLATYYGFGVNNSALAPSLPGAPVIWNSIVYFNSTNTGLAPTYLPGTATGPDLFGLVLPATAGQVGMPGTVNYSDFCGAALGTCENLTMPPAGSVHGCISAFPDFVIPPGGSAAPEFLPRCGGPGSLPNCTCYQVVPPDPVGVGGSRCIDQANAAPALPANVTMPGTDAVGATRIVPLNLGASNPDLGAREKQICTP